MKKITLPYTPEKNISGGILAETGESSAMHMDIIAGQVEYQLPDRNILGVYAYVPMEVKEKKEKPEK